jgi:molecular chaperone IbpA
MSHFGFAPSSKIQPLGVSSFDLLRRMREDRLSAGSPRVLDESILSDFLRAAITSTTTGGLPYNIVQVENDVYEIELALAGFKEDEISISVKDRQLVVEGKVADKTERTFLHRGLAMRDFKHGFTLGQYIEVKGAEFADGLLRIRCVREVPEAAKPRQIEITRKT